MTTAKTYSELIENAIDTLKNNDDIFVQCCEELDSWNGFLGDDRAFDMCMIDELHYGLKLSDFISRLTSDFDINDNYFYYSIWGLESFSYSLAEHYRYITNDGELLDNLIDNFSDLNINWIDSDFNELLENIIELKEK